MKKPVRIDSKTRDFTEHALAQVEAAIPTIGYLPPTKRPKKKHIIIISDTAPTEIAPNVERIAFADPIGFLAALMHGNPVAVHRVEKDGTVKTEWVNADMKERQYIARYFTDKIVPYMTRTRALDAKPTAPDSEEEMFRRAAHGEG